MTFRAIEFQVLPFSSANQTRMTSIQAISIARHMPSD
jgi:hypothetical protein